MSNSPEQGSVQATPTLDKKKSLILGAVGLAFMVLIFWKVIPQIGDYGQAWSALQARRHRLLHTRQPTFPPKQAQLEASLFFGFGAPAIATPTRCHSSTKNW